MENTGNELMVRQAPALNMEVIKKYICPKATDQEAFTFLQLCKAQGLNPFLKEAYLIKYGNENATIVTGKDTFTKRADRLPQYDGFKAGIIIMSNNQITHREGSFVVDGETLLGGWAEVFRKDRTQSFRNEVSLKEYARRKGDGSLMSNWKSMPATMIRKVALVQSLREAFPDEFGEMYSPEEMPVDAGTLPTYNYSEEPKYPTPQNTGAKPPIKQPQKKQAAPPEETQKVTVKVVDVQAREGEKDGKSYKLYVIFDENEEKYSTFSETFAELASQSIPEGFDVSITYKTGQYGKNIINLERAA